MFKLAALSLAAASAAALDTHLTISSGEIIGLEGDEAMEYRGIPYAAPVQRWTPAVAPSPWETALDATTDGIACPQTCEDGVSLPPMMCSKGYSEADCLSLNVFAPKGDNTDLPVMVWVHGGNFKQGAGTPSLIYDGAAIASQTNTIVVSINYRLGMLGFLSSVEDGIDGNYGLQDQQLALKWVQENIATFGGSPDHVTLFGQSAGAMSVASHMSMPSSAGLFQQAIMESEPFALPFRDTDDWAGFAKTFAKFAGCTTGHLHKELDADCLRTLDLEDLLAAQHEAENDIPVELPHAGELFMPMPPVWGEGSLLAEHPLKVFQAGENMDIPFMIGTVAQEAVEFVYGAFTTPLSRPLITLGYDLIYGPETTPKIFEQYPVSAEDEKDMRDYASGTTTDSLFDCATRNATLSAKQSSPVFVYHFDHPMSFGEEAWGPNFEYCWNVTCHAGELPFVFDPEKAAAFGYDYDADEVQLTNTMIQFWGNFAHTGNPGMVDGLVWPAFDSDLQTMLFQTPASTVETAANADACDFWDSVGYRFQ